MSDVDRNGEEELIISKDDARNLAEKFNGEDPCPDIPPALLSADNIIEYAKKTGMIAPLFRGGEKSRMKKASYEGRIGEYAYKYDKHSNLHQVPFEKVLGRKVLNVEANSIVFVECDIDFRLPDFIAIRFNLHIRHVHRGLLLGTGPLVDPGYWGKLCIPLHNLTDKDYPIPKEEGLIWIEFTKTSGKPSGGRKPSTSDRDKFLDIKKFITRAARQYDAGASVPIRSSIPVAVGEAHKSAVNFAKSADKSAKSAANSADKIEKRFTRIGYIAIAGFIISLIILVCTTYSNIQYAYNSVGPQAKEAHIQSVLNKKDIEDIKSKIDELSSDQSDIEILQSKIKAMGGDIKNLDDRSIANQNQDKTP